MTDYVVTAGRVTVETAVPGGRAHVDRFRGDPVPDDVPEEQIETLLRLGHITVAGDDAGGRRPRGRRPRKPAAGQQPAAGGSGGGQTDAGGGGERPDPDGQD